MVWRQLKVFFKKHWLISGLGAGFIILLLLFLPIFRSSWLYYPESLRAKLALKKLEVATEKDIYCREDCQAKRLLYKNLIYEFAVKNQFNFKQDLENSILKPGVLPEIRMLFISIWQELKWDITPAIQNYYSDLNNPLEIRSSLTIAWPELKNPSFFKEVVSQFYNSKNTKEQINLLDLLISSDDKSVLNLIWDLILGDRDDSFKRKAFFLLANIANKQSAYLVADVIKLRSILENGDYPHRIKDLAIMALSDYYDFFPELTEELLVDVVNRSRYFDSYQRTFAIEILNKYRAEKIPLPELSQEDLGIYFSN